MKKFSLQDSPKISSGFNEPSSAYFEELQAKIIDKINNQAPKVIPFYRNRKYIAIVSAAAILLLIMIPVFSNYNSEKLDKASLESYLSYQSSLDNHILINEIENEAVANLLLSENIENEAIETILSNENAIENLILE